MQCDVWYTLWVPTSVTPASVLNVFHVLRQLKKAGYTHATYRGLAHSMGVGVKSARRAAKMAAKLRLVRILEPAKGRGPFAFKLVSLREEASREG